MAEQKRRPVNVNNTPESVHRPAMSRLRDQDAARPVSGCVAIADIAELLDEIDSVLEENAEAFVASYVQQSGQ